MCHCPVSFFKSPTHSYDDRRLIIFYQSQDSVVKVEKVQKSYCKKVHLGSLDLHTAYCPELNTPQ